MNQRRYRKEKSAPRLRRKQDRKIQRILKHNPTADLSNLSLYCKYGHLKRNSPEQWGRLCLDCRLIHNHRRYNKIRNRTRELMKRKRFRYIRKVATRFERAAKAAAALDKQKLPDDPNYITFERYEPEDNTSVESLIDKPREHTGNLSDSLY